MAEEKRIAKIELEEPDAQARIPKIFDQSDLNEAFQNFSKAGRSLLELELKRDKKIAKAKDTFKTRIFRMRKRVSNLFEAIKQYCEDNEEEVLPHNRKSVELDAGILGWRLGKPSIVLKVSEEKAIDYIRRRGFAKKYIKTVRVLNIEALRNNPEDARKFSQVLEFLEAQDHFFLKPTGVQASFTQRMKALKESASKLLGHTR